MHIIWYPDGVMTLATYLIKALHLCILLHQDPIMTVWQWLVSIAKKLAISIMSVQITKTQAWQQPQQQHQSVKKTRPLWPVTGNTGLNNLNIGYQRILMLTQTSKFVPHQQQQLNPQFLDPPRQSIHCWCIPHSPIVEQHQEIGHLHVHSLQCRYSNNKPFCGLARSWSCLASSTWDRQHIVTEQGSCQQSCNVWQQERQQI